MRSASEFHRRSVENLRRRWRFVFQSPAAKRFGAITARSSAGRRGAEEVAALQSQIQALQIELDNPSHALALLRARREQPRGRRAAECSQQFPPSDGDCHTPLPCEARRGKDTTPRACSLGVRGGAECWLLPPLSSASTTPAASSSRTPPSPPRALA